MTRPQRVVLALVTAAAAILLAGTGWVSQPYAAPAVWDGEPKFVTARAWDDVQALATQFPRRWSGTPDRQAAADWIATRLVEAGLDVHRATFPAVIGESTPVTLENVWGISRGTDRSNEIVVAIGNYDMAPTSYQAASDTAGHVGTGLELARLIHGTRHRRTFIFLFPDGEEWGMLGARHFARTFPQRRQIVAAVSIEDLDPGNLAALGVDGIGQFHGYAPMWLRSLAAAAAARERYPTVEADPVSEWLARAVLVSATDQGPFLGAGIPAIDLAGRGDDPALKAQVYHLPGDTIEKMRPAAVEAYGRIQERILRSIDAMDRVPSESAFYLRLAPDRIVPRWWLLIVQLGVFVLVATAAYLRLRGTGLPTAVLVNEIVQFGVIIVPLLVWLAAVRLAPVAGLIPNHELYPPPPRHPLLTHVHWWAVLASAAVLGLTFLVLRRLRRMLLPPYRARERAVGITSLLLGLVVIVLVALVDNPFGAVTFLLLPAVLWIWVEPARSTPGRIAGVLAIAIGFAPLAMLFVRYAGYLGIGRYILWYMFMSVAYGQFTLLRIVLALATVAVAIRLVVLAAVAKDRPILIA